ncbi:rRNA maturation RNase YbeY [Kaarinaea lacus]
MSLTVDVQKALAEDSRITIPADDQVEDWARRAVETAIDTGNFLQEQELLKRELQKKDMQVTVRIVSEEEITRLNSQYRHKNTATNVLSFPFVLPPGIPVDELPGSLGDLVICASVVNREADQQKKSASAHWAHMVIHGTLHLLGYDHQDEEQAKDMESLETAVLEGLGFDDPYN